MHQVTRKLNTGRLMSGLVLLGLVLSATAFDTDAKTTNRFEQCRNGTFTLFKNFPAGAFSHCQWTADNAVTLFIEPEDEKINPSPWYAFKARSFRRTDLFITLDYGDFKHRYHPKIDVGDQWESVKARDVIANDDETQFTFKLRVGLEQITVAAQPIIDSADYSKWTANLLSSISRHSSSNTFNSTLTFGKRNIGQSVNGKSLRSISYISDPTLPFLVFIGRQHPPEVTGAIGMMAFIPELFKNDALSRQFREQFNLLIFPLVNPDGVDLGYWRHNVNGIDLNRDWGPFTQPETQAVIKEIERLTQQSTVLHMLDFHSTTRNILYTHEDNSTEILPTFSRDWFNQINAQGPLPYARQSSHNPARPTTKTYFFERYGIPAITYEFDDVGEVEDIEASARNAARSYMKLLLEEAQ